MCLESSLNRSGSAGHVMFQWECCSSIARGWNNPSIWPLVLQDHTEMYNKENKPYKWAPKSVNVQKIHVSQNEVKTFQHQWSQVWILLKTTCILYLNAILSAVPMQYTNSQTANRKGPLEVVLGCL